MKLEGKLMIMWTVLLILGVWAFTHITGKETYVRVIEYAAAAEMRSMKMQTSAYSSSPDETDDTPDITASNTKTRSGVVANNCLPFGTKLWIDGREYVVEDRMNRRYGCDKLDIWMESKDEALTYGRREVIVELLEI